MTVKKLKSQEFATKLGIAEKLQIDKKAGIITLPEEFYGETLEVEKIGVTLDQLKKEQKHAAKVLPAVTYAAGEASVELFRENPELKEVKFNYAMGNTMVHGYFEPEGKTPVRNVVEVHGAGDRGELGKVYKELKSLFADING